MRLEGLGIGNEIKFGKGDLATYYEHVREG